MSHRYTKSGLCYSSKGLAPHPSPNIGATSIRRKSGFNILPRIWLLPPGFFFFCPMRTVYCEQECHKCEKKLPRIFEARFADDLSKNDALKLSLAGERRKKSRGVRIFISCCRLPKVEISHCLFPR